MSKPKSKVLEVTVRGPLAAVAEDFRASLLAAGYTPLTAVNKLRSLGYLSSWLQARDIEVGDLTEERVQEYLRERRAEGHVWEISMRALKPLLELLASRGMLPPAVKVQPTDSLQVLLARFLGYLVEERGLVASTAVGYVRDTRRFLGSLAPNGNVGQLTAADIPHAIRAETVGLSVATVQGFVSTVRSFLRFCHLEGLTDVDLSTAALSMTGRRHSPLPRGIPRAHISAMLRSCDRRTAVGRRDHAVLVTLVRLGLRAEEVANLTLDDLDWRAAEIVVRGKGRRVERLPLSADVGAAIAGYLRWGRPQTSHRAVFLTTIAPVTKLGSGGVSAIVRRACRRAGLAPVGAHRLRHTLACEMVSAGVPLRQIGQVLRHRHIDTTAVYARVGVAQLRTLAQPWPAEAGR
jgi:integrase/recombinase XerD